MNLHLSVEDLQPIIIIGMHRSGTSLLTRLLRDLGISMGNNLTVNAEPPYIQSINRRILANAGAKWSSVSPIIKAMSSDKFIDAQVEAVFSIIQRKNGVKPFMEESTWNIICQGEASAWGWKDPLNTITFPIWIKVFPHSRFIHIIRNGVDVAISIHMRTTKVKRKWWKWWWYAVRGYGTNTLDFNYCFRLWEQYTTYAIDQRSTIPPLQYLELRYEDLLSDPMDHLSRIVNFLDLPTKYHQLDAVCSQIDQNRLDNSRLAIRYRAEISTLISSPVMQKLGYTYPIENY